MKFLDANGVRKFKEYTENTFITADDVSEEIESVTTNGYTKNEIDLMLANLLTAMEGPMNGNWTIIDDNSGRKFIFTHNE